MSIFLILFFTTVCSQNCLEKLCIPRLTKSISISFPLRYVPADSELQQASALPQAQLKALVLALPQRSEHRPAFLLTQFFSVPGAINGNVLQPEDRQMEEESQDVTVAIA